MVTMRRRTVLSRLVAAAAGAGGLAACSARGDRASAWRCDHGIRVRRADSRLDDGFVAGTTERDAVRPAAGQPRRPGRTRWARRDCSFDRGADRPLPTRVWYPATGAAPGARARWTAPPPAPGRFPLIIFSHGLTSAPDDFAALLSRWAQAGFVVAGPTFPHTAYGCRRLRPRTS